MWNKVGMSRNEKGLKEAIYDIRIIRESFCKKVRVPGEMNNLNPELADFLELGELIAMDALARKESCGGHLREEYCTEEGEALRDDTNYANVSAWESDNTNTFHNTLRFITRTRFCIKNLLILNLSN